jgi:hypothetical protein
MHIKTTKRHTRCFIGALKKNMTKIYYFEYE